MFVANVSHIIGARVGKSRLVRVVLIRTRTNMCIHKELEHGRCTHRGFLLLRVPNITEKRNNIFKNPTLRTGAGPSKSMAVT